MDLKETPTHDFQRHPWEKARFGFFRRHLQQALAHEPARPLDVLDVGAGDGWFSSQLLDSLPPGSQVTCWDIGYDEESPPQVATPGLSMTATRPHREYDLVLLLDVAEHVPNDLDFVQTTVNRNLKADGWLLFSVPAWQALYCQHDRALGHFRRYRPEQARRLLTRAGLQLQMSGGLFHSLLAPRGLQVLKEHLLPGQRTASASTLEWRRGRRVGDLVSAALAADGAISSWGAKYGLAFPGLSWWALCRK